MQVSIDTRTLLITFSVIAGVALLISIILIAWLLFKIRRIRLMPDADALDALRASPLSGTPHLWQKLLPSASWVRHIGQRSGISHFLNPPSPAESKGVSGRLRPLSTPAGQIAFRIPGSGAGSRQTEDNRTCGRGRHGGTRWSRGPYNNR